MEISNNGKKIMTFILAMAFVLSGIMYTPKSASAADVPKVTFLGATLRLGQDADNNGKQSMKIGIQINNASKAKSCAINIKVGGKTCTVTTEEIEASKGYTHDKMQSVDVDNDTVIYAVVLTNIPESAFDTNIEIQGTATDLNGKEYFSNEEYQTKTVNGIVKSLQEAYPSLGIGMMNGMLVKTSEPYASLKFEEGVVADSVSGGLGTFKYWRNEETSSKATCSLSEDGTYYTVTTEVGSGKGIGYQFNWDNLGKCACVASMRASGEENVSVAYVNWFAGGFSPISNTPVTSLSNEWQDISFIYPANSYQGDFFTTETGGQRYDIQSYNIYKAITVNDIANSDEFAEELQPGMSIECIKNGDFEDDKNDWSCNGGTLSIVNEDGNKYASLTGRGNRFARIQQNINGDFKAGSTFTISCDICSTDETSKYCNVVLNYNGNEYDNICEILADGKWHHAELTYTIPEDITTNVTVGIAPRRHEGFWDEWGEDIADFSLDNVSVIYTVK